MPRLLRLLAIAAAAASLCLAPRAQGDEVDDLAARGVILRLRDVKEGMRATCKTVFQGTKIDTFDVEIIGVMERTGAGRSQILIRVLNGQVVERKTGIVAGMSGSPVYVDGKLIGAVAYTYPGELEPIGGVTPIEEMLEALEPAGSASSTKQARLRSPVLIGDQVYTRVALRGVGHDEGEPVGDATLALVPVATPVFANGFRSRSLGKLTELLKPYGMQVMQGAGGRMTGVEAELEPGAALGVDLVSGDLSMTVFGTVTYRDGDRVLGFGHPLFAIGPSLAPMSTGYIHTVIPMRTKSTKLASAIKPVGAITQDWPPAIGGVIGRKAPMIPVRIVARDLERDIERAFEFSVMDYRDLTASFAVSAALDACDSVFAGQFDGTLRMEMRAEGEGIEPIVRRNQFYTSGDVLFYSVEELADAVVNLTSNPFERVTLTRLELTVEFESKRQAADIRRVTVAPSKVEPGEEVTVSVVLEPRDGKPETLSATFEVPKDTPGGNLRIGVASGYRGPYLRQRLALFLPKPTDLADLLWLWEQEGSNSELRILAALPSRGAAVGTQQLKALPASVLAVMGSSRATGTGMQFPLQELSQSFDTQWHISGNPLYVTAQVLGKPAPGAPRRPPSAPPTQQPPPPPGNNRPAFAASWAMAGSRLPVSPLWGRLQELGLVEGNEQVAVAQGAPPSGLGQSSRPPSGGRPPSGSSRKPTSKTPPKKKREGIGRPTEVWLSSSTSDFLKGEHEGSCATTAGDVRIAPRARKLLSADDLYVWSLAAAPDGSAYAGLGNGGRVYRIDVDGKAEPFAETEAAGVYALTVSKSGALLAGLSPGARLVQFDAKGKQTTLCDLDEDYIWHLLWESADTLLIATGARGRVYRLKLGGEPQLAYDLPQRHVRKLARGTDGTLFASTSDLDLLYKLADNGGFSTLHQSADGEILGLAPGEDGTLYFTVARKGNIYQWKPSGQIDTYFESSQTGAFDLARDEQGNLYLATTGSSAKGIVYKVDPDKAGMRVLEPEQAQALCLALTSKQKLLVGLGNSAAVHELSLTGNHEATFESAVHDGKRACKWGTITWAAQTPEGASVEIEFRSGNTEKPDEAWSEWQQPAGVGNVRTVACPASRYLQFRAKLFSEAGKEGPRLQMVEVVYLPRNQAPEVTLREPTSGVRWSGTKKVTWTGSDPDADPLEYTLSISADEGATWQVVKLKDAKQTTHELDTKKLKDGTYRVKVEASDGKANPGDELTAEQVSDPFIIDNKAPFLVLKEETQPGEGEKQSVVFKAHAVDQLSRLTGADFRIDEGEWQATRATDGMFDSAAEDIEFEVTGVTAKHDVELRVRDEAGNLTTKKRSHDFPVKKEAAKQPEGAADTEKPDAKAPAGGEANG